MSKKYLMIGLMLMVFISLTALADFEEAQRLTDRLFESRMEAFNSRRSPLRNMSQWRTHYAIDEVISQYAMDQDEWINGEKSVHFYDSQGRLEEVITYLWEEEEWFEEEIVTKVEWRADGLLNLVKYIMPNPIEDGWLDLVIASHEYNDMQQIEKVRFEVLDFMTQQHEIETEMEFHYDERNMLETITYIDYNGMYPEAYYKDRSLFFYDGQGRVIEAIDEEYDFDVQNNGWVTYGKVVFEYHDSDQSDYGSLQHFLNRFALMMVELMYMSYTPFGSLEKDIYYEWYDEDWIPEFQTLYYYDANDILEYVEHQEYYYDIEQWFAFEREYLYYDEMLNLVETKVQTKWDEDWEDDYRLLISYKEVSSTEEYIKASLPSMVQNYPNPFNPETTIVFNLSTAQYIELNIYDVTGRKVNSLAKEIMSAGEHRLVWDGTSFNGDSLSSGVYFYNLDTEKGTFTGKMMMIK